MMKTTPNLTAEQRSEALDKAMQVRKERAVIREGLKNGLIGIERVLELADGGCEAAANMRVRQLISAMPGYALAKTERTMRELRISDGKRVKGLGSRQRAALVGIFGGRARDGMIDDQSKVE